MSIRARICVRHEIEYSPDEMFVGSQLDAVKSWLFSNGVNLYVSEFSGGGEEWEIPKHELREIPDLEIKTLGKHGECGYVSADDLERFVKSMLDAPTGDYAYVQWF